MWVLGKITEYLLITVLTSKNIKMVMPTLLCDSQDPGDNFHKSPWQIHVSLANLANVIIIVIAIIIAIVITNSLVNGIISNPLHNGFKKQLQLLLSHCPPPHGL